MEMQKMLSFVKCKYICGCGDSKVKMYPLDREVVNDIKDGLRDNYGQSTLSAEQFGRREGRLKSW